MAHYWNNWVALDDWVIWHHVRIHVIGSWGVTQTTSTHTVGRFSQMHVLYSSLKPPQSPQKFLRNFINY